MADTPTNAGSSLPAPLTDREREILTCLSEGLSNSQIALRLHLALRTVKWYNSHIYSKLGVRKRHEAVERAAALGLLTPPSTASGTHGKHNLPPQSTPFVGRQRELAEIHDLLADPNLRLLTIMAPGGMGKTRLCLEAARIQIGRFTDGVIFVPLAPLSGASDIVTAIAEHIGFSFYGEISPAQQLLDFLRDRSLLLILDNFEHLLAGAPFAADLVRNAPAVRVLTTSRERLNLSGETVYVLRGLDFPDWQTPERIEVYDAVKLFVQTAQRVHPDFELQAQDLISLARICHLTAGMPLAIELATGWLDILSLEHIANEIQQGIGILETNLRDLPERHRSVRATFERTWERLTDEERATFSRLSVFRGGFTLPAAQAVAGANVHHLRGLVQKALIQTEGSERFAIHELLRQFGADKLAETGELPSIQGKHAAFFADFMQEQRDALFTHQQFEALNRIGTDFENVRSAWNGIVARQLFDELPKFLDGLWFFLNVRTRFQEGVDLFETTGNIVQALPPSDTTELTLARLWARLSWFYNFIDLSEKAKVTAEAAIHLLDRHDSPSDMMFAYRSLGGISLILGDRENTRRMGEASCELARQLGDRYWEAYSLILCSRAARMYNDDMDVILRQLRQARAIYEELGDRWGVMLSYVTESGIAFDARDYEQAKHWLIQYQGLAKVFGSAYHLANSALYLGIIALQQRHYGQAWVLLHQSLRTYWNAGYPHVALAPLLRMAELLLHEDKAESAVGLLALTDRYPGQHQYLTWFEKRPYRLKELRQQLEARLGPDRFATVWERGRTRELSALVAELLAEPADE